MEEKLKSCEFLISCYFSLHNCQMVDFYCENYTKLDPTDQYDFLNSINLIKALCNYCYESKSVTDSINKYFYPEVEFYANTDTREEMYSLKLIPKLAPYMNRLLENKEYKILDTIIHLINQAEIKNPGFKKSNFNFYYVCYKYYETIGKTDKALEYLKKYTFYNGLYEQQEFKNKVEFARIEYETNQQKVKLETEKKQEVQKQKIIRNSFIASSILLLLLIALTINRNKLKRTIEMERMRSRLSRDLHDDIGSTLSSINILSHTAKNHLSGTNDAKTQATLEKINERSQRLLNSMRDIIWNINPENDTLEEVMSRMRDYASTLLEAKGIEYRIDFPKETADCKLSMEVKNNMYLIFKEAVNNLSKYSQCSHALITLTFDDKNIYLIIEDDGTGFQKETISHNGGLRNMQHRAEAIKGNFIITSPLNQGTKIELIIPRYS